MLTLIVIITTLIIDSLAIIFSNWIIFEISGTHMMSVGFNSQSIIVLSIASILITAVVFIAMLIPEMLVRSTQNDSICLMLTIVNFIIKQYLIFKTTIFALNFVGVQFENNYVILYLIILNYILGKVAKQLMQAYGKA